jgi:hypothetical protein
VNLEPIKLFRRTQTDDYSRVMRGEITAAPILRSLPDLSVNRPADKRADSIAIAICPDEIQAQPMISIL